MNPTTEAITTAQRSRKPRYSTTEHITTTTVQFTSVGNTETTTRSSTCRLLTIHHIHHYPRPSAYHILAVSSTTVGSLKSRPLFHEQTWRFAFSPGVGLQGRMDFRCRLILLFQA